MKEHHLLLISDRTKRYMLLFLLAKTKTMVGRKACQESQSNPTNQKQ